MSIRRPPPTGSNETGEVGVALVLFSSTRT
jgi:hypothetical protein